ncbi:hypothetical protein MACJ_003156 [Theileria orientalis]|uniref:GYF domain-containing protein n=1 Tax=Theileria orientalis TaxID=68886 RepID=A0A976M7G4_THEOR|nr:hypothetical protein MACJ_003156 [Theileria orientalis]
MDYVFSDDDCCIKCQHSLNSLNMWYYLDDFGNQQGPFDSFIILYYIHSGYFDDGSVFFLYDKNTGGPSNYNTLNNYVEKIVEDVNNHAEDIFQCSHLIENLSSSDDFPTNLDEVHMLDGISNLRGSKEMIIPGESIYPTAISNPSSNEFSTNSQSSEEANDESNSINSNNLLKKRIFNNLKEADAHLNRVNSRRISHMLEKNLSKDSI